MDTVYMVASGDLRLAANQNCQAAQAEMEAQVVAALGREFVNVKRAHPFDEVKRHGFIDSQAYGMEVFRGIPERAPVVVAEAVWQYSHHVLAGLYAHRGPILTVANWSGTWPGLVGLLNLNASLTKAGVRYSSLWSEDFTDEFFTRGLRRWLKKGSVRHDASHVRGYDEVDIPRKAAKNGATVAVAIRRDQAIMGVFDEGCMGMYNAIIPDELLHRTGVFKERLSQSSLYAAMQHVSSDEARSVYQWLLDSGMHFVFGSDEETELTERQVLEQCAMYIAAVRIADEFKCDTIGIQYQQGLKDLTPASDLAEGLLNNVSRPPVYSKDGRELYAGAAIPHFNEVDECAGLDALVTNRVWTALGFAPETTLHDLRWGRHFRGDGIDDFVWVLMISGAAPPAHFVDGYRGASSERQPPMYFRLGGGTLKGVSRPGWVVWSRVYVENKRLRFDTGLAEAVTLPEAETRERLRLTTPQWPIMHAVIKGVTRDQMMARHKSNHIQVAYAPSEKEARQAMYTKAAAMHQLGLAVSFCGVE